MTSTRRELLAFTAVGLASQVLAFPVPRWKKPVPALAAEVPWALPAGAFRRLGSQRFRASRGISRMQFSPSGAVLVAADSIEIRGWEVATARPLFVIPYPKKVDLNSGRVTDQQTIVTLARVEGASEYEIHHYRFDTGQAQIRIKTTATNIESSLFCGDGSRVVVVHDGTLSVFDGTRPGKLWSEKIGARNNRAGAMYFVDADRALAVAGGTGLTLYDIETGKERGKLQGSDSPGTVQAQDYAVASPRGDFLATRGGQNGEKITIWNVSSAAVVCKLDLKNDDSRLFGFSADAALLYLKQKGTLVAITVATGREAFRTVIGTMSDDMLSPQGDVIASSPEDAVLLTSVATGQPLPLSADPPGLPSTMRFAGADRLIGQFNGFNGWAVWDLAAGTTKLLQPRKGFPVGIANDARTVLVFEEDMLHRWDVVKGTGLAGLPFESHLSTPMAALTGDGYSIVAAVSDGMKVWNAATGTAMVIAGKYPERGEAMMLQLSNGGTAAAIAMRMALDNRRPEAPFIEVFSLSTRRSIAVWPAPGSLTGMQFSRDGSLLALGYNGGYTPNNSQQYSVRVAEAATGRPLVTLPTSSSEQRILALSPDNRLLAVAFGEKPALQIWELASGQQRSSWPLPGDAYSLAFAPDSASLAVACCKGPVLLWDLRGRHGPTPLKPDGKATAELPRRLSEKPPEAALEALRLIAAWPALTLPVIAAALPPVKPPDEKHLQTLLKNLSADSYAVRETASRDLLAMGDLAVPGLKALLEVSGCAEARLRAENMLEDLSTPTATDLLTTRGVEAAEWAATAEAKALLKKWAAGASGARLTREANAALQRLSS